MEIPLCNSLQLQPGRDLNPKQLAANYLFFIASIRLWLRLNESAS